MSKNKLFAKINCGSLEKSHFTKENEDVFTPNSGDNIQGKVGL